MTRDPRCRTDITDAPLDVAAVLALLDELTGVEAGGVDVFIGRVRDHDGGAAVGRLEYSAHPTAAQRLADVAAAVGERHEVLGVVAVHRTGRLELGDIAVVCAVAAAHRDAAFAGCRDLIDTLKAEVPIWKHQVFADGTSEWVGTP